MNTKIQKTYEALFLLEDLREILRETSPEHEFSVEQEEKFKNILSSATSILGEIEAEEEGKLDQFTEGESTVGTRSTRVPLKYITDKIELRTREEEFVNIDPIQAGGRLTPEARKALIAYGDGYSVCDYCSYPFRLDHIKKPPIGDFFADLAEFVGMDVARVVRGARNGFQIVMNALLEKGDVVLVSSLAHYSLCLAIESSGGIWKEVSVNGSNVITGENVAQKIEEEKPKLVAISHFDYKFGNEHDVRGIANVCKEYDVPFLYNGAYSVGVMPVNGKEIGTDFVVGSGHKSMASPAPSGVLATTDEFADKIFTTMKSRGDLTGRSFETKETYLLGCTLMGAPLVAMMASFPTVKERIKNWEEEVKKSNHFIKELMKIDGTKILSEMPRMHTLSNVSIKPFDEIARSHKRKGYFLYNELSKRKITGIFPGATKSFELNVYGLSWDQINYLSAAFKEIAEEYKINVI
jgi:Sep-tRNA:Cys-tRNA synthetase